MKVSNGSDNADEDAASSNQGGGACSECKEKTPIYQCPRCNIRTCSLECCQNHKKRTGCSGKRNRSAFVPVSRMTDSTVRSDYFFLEEVLEQIPQSGKRARTQEVSSNQGNSKRMRRLVQQAERRGTTLQIMPPMMVRHISNTSWYSGPRDTITWKVEVVLHPSKSVVSFNLSENEENIIDHVTNHFEKEKISISSVELYLFLMRLPSSARNPRYTAVYPSDSLKAKLRGMTVVEHPTLHLVPKDIVDQFPTGSDNVSEVPTANDKAADTEMT